MYGAGNEYGVECEYEWEYEDGGLWVGTVGAVEVLEWAEGAPCTTGAPASVLDGRLDGVRDDDRAKQGSEFQVNENPEEEPAEDGWWDLEVECPSLEDEEVGAPQAESPHHDPCETSRPDHSFAAGEQRTRKKPRTTADRQWEETRQNARLRQMLSDGPSSEDEDENEKRHRRFAEAGRWMPEMYGSP